MESVSDRNVVRYGFGHFELQPGERRLLASGTAVAITPRAFDLLLVLLERNGHLVTKEDLLAQAWPGVIVEENALHAQISALRKLLGPDAITTVPGAGYRFELGVTPLSPPVESHAEVVPRHNLPKALTSFIGREQQIAELKGLLRQTRLLTLSGAGGCGKTRLALELAGQVAESYAHGVSLVELAALGNGELVPQTVADVLGLKESASEARTQTIASYLRSKHLLLMFDNAEHLLAACAELVQKLLARCPQLSILVTSRERLGILGELTYRVPSLSVPEPNQQHVAETLVACESARLFIERARLQEAHFGVTAQSAPAIASICSHLDGIPLAIELAAARVRAISVEELNQRLDQRFRLLTDTSRAALPRHRTLGAMIDWSYDLLNAAEKGLFSRASVFAGGFTLDAAEQVLSGGAVDEASVIDLLTSLVDKNLLQAEDHRGTTRYRQLETVRQYGRGRLRESAEERACKQRHLSYFVALAESGEDGLRGSEREGWAERLEAEHENLRAALASASEPDGDSTSGLRLASALFPFWYIGGYWSEGRGWLSPFLGAVPEGRMQDVRAKALNAAGTLAHLQGDGHFARGLLEESLVIRRGLGHRRGIASTLNNLGNVLGTIGDYVAARQVLEESLTIAREIGDTWGTGRALMSLARLVYGQREIGLARVLAQECVDIEREVAGLDISDALAVLSALALEEGDAAAAVMLCCDALAKPMDRVHAHDLLETTACAESVLGNATAAAVIWGHTERLRQDIGMSLSHFDQLRHEHSVAKARAVAADYAEFDSAWQRGRAMTTAQAITFVLDPEAA
jgi:non-specific serine/threonine protein kinase